MRKGFLMVWVGWKVWFVFVVLYEGMMEMKVMGLLRDIGGVWG